jgi:hypothetical protein
MQLNKKRREVLLQELHMKIDKRYTLNMAQDMLSEENEDELDVMIRNEVIMKLNDLLIRKITRWLINGYTD